MRTADEKLRRVRESISLRNSSAHRERRQARAYRNAKCLEWGAIAAALWVIFYPVPYWPVLWAAAMIPFIALALYWMNPADYEIAEDPRSRRVDLILPIMFCGLALALRALLDIQLASWTRMLLPALAGAALLTLAAGALRSTAFSVMITFTVFATYSSALIAFADVYFDNASPRAQLAKVDALRVSSGRRATYYAQLSPGISEASSEVTVDKTLYRELSRFDQVCVLIYPGALGLEWFEVKQAAQCAASARKSPTSS